MYEQLRKQRKLKNVKVSVLAKLINKTENVYYKKENGLIPFTLEESKKISQYFKKPIEKIFLKNVPDEKIKEVI